MSGETEWLRRRAWLPIKIEGRWIWLRHFDERGYKVFVERRRAIIRRPDSQSRVDIATIVLIVVLAWVIGGHGIWTSQPFPVSR